MQATKNAGVHDCIVHSDHGSAFSSNEYIAYCKNHNITRSMSAVGACAENHPIETF
jgi:putative transposase